MVPAGRRGALLLARGRGARASRACSSRAAAPAAAAQAAAGAAGAAAAGAARGGGGWGLSGGLAALGAALAGGAGAGYAFREEIEALRLPERLAEARRAVQSTALGPLLSAVGELAPSPRSLLAPPQSAPQGGVVSGPRPTALFLTVHLCERRRKGASKTGESPLQQCAAIAAGKTLEFGRRGRCSVALGMSPRVWSAVQSGVPAGIPTHSFGLQPRAGSLGRLPATGGDLFLHVKGEDRGECFAMARELLEALPADSIEDAEDVYGFRFKRGKDVLGYQLREVAGAGAEAREPTPQQRVDAAVIPTTGGSYALAQQWRHDLYAFADLPEPAQDAVIGKSKRTGEYLGGVPLDSEPHRVAQALERGLPEAAHVARMIGLDKHGQRLQIVRQSMPCGSVAPGPVPRDNIHEPGLFFLAYSNDPAVFNYMLDRMVGLPIRGSGSDKRPPDSIMKYSSCVRGQMYYVPSQQQLLALAVRAALPATPHD
jgi:putative iron-dependent peroxidase